MTLLRVTSSIILLILGCMSATPHSIAAAREPADEPLAAFAIDLELQPEEEGQIARPSGLLHAAYEIDVYGGMATGTLVQEFSNDAATEGAAIYECSIEGDPQLLFLRSGSPDQTGELHAELVQDATPKQQERGTASAKRTPRNRSAKSGVAKARLVRSDPFELPPEGPVTVRTGFQLALPVQGRLFRLVLPVVRAAHIAAPSSTSVPLSVRVTVYHDEPLSLAQSPSHEILVDFEGDRTVIETVETEISGERPFVLEFALNDRNSPTAAGYIRRGEDGRRAVETVLTPPEELGEQATRPKQMLFIIDSSGSMGREGKMEQARRAVSYCVDQLRPEDRFNIVDFDDDFRMMAPAPVAPASFNKENVNLWLASLRTDGHTTLSPALESTLAQPDDPERHRMIIVVTDGNLQDEPEVMQTLEEGLGDARLFVVGTGTQIRKPTLLRLAELGRGAATFASDPQSLETAVTELFDSISQPIGWDVTLDWDGADVAETSPSRLPDLYADRPFRALAWFSGELPSVLRLRMSTMDGEQQFNVKLPPQIATEDRP